MTEAKILADSLNEWGDRLTTFKIKFPRIIEAEVLRHRVFSYSSASSRAVGLEKHIQKVAAEPFIPKQFTEDCKGMSAKKSLDGQSNLMAQEWWKEALGISLSICEDLKRSHIPS
jgi:thymidylate synthase ThyX